MPELMRYFASRSLCDARPRLLTATAFLALVALFDSAVAADSTQPQAAPDQTALTDCDALAGAPDMNGRGPGVAFGKIDTAKAVPACEDALRADPIAARLLFNLGRAKLAAKDYQGSMTAYRQAADLGYTRAMTGIGMIYEFGEGVPGDYAEAVRWFQKAADLGDVLGMTELAASYYRGKGNPQDYAKALDWNRRAADLGSASAIYDIGIQYLNGHGVPKDYEQSRVWFARAAELGHTHAMINLGWLYDLGEGVPVDAEIAMSWWRKAADLGDSKAMILVGRSYLGSLTKASRSDQDHAQGLVWLEKATALGEDPFFVAELFGTKRDIGGISKDPARAADAAIKSLRMRNNVLLASLATAWGDWTDDFHIAFQQRLKDAGLFSGPIDGSWSPALELAIEKLENEGYPVLPPG